MGYLKGSIISFNKCLSFYCFHIPISDKMAREISADLLPVAFSVDWMLVAKKYVLSAVSTYPINQPCIYF